MNSKYEASFRLLCKACDSSKVKESLVILMSIEMLTELVTAHERLTGKHITEPKLDGIKVFKTHSLPKGREWVFALNNNKGGN